MTDEDWKPIPGYEGYYEVSSKGSVKSLFRFVDVLRSGKVYRAPIKERMLTPIPDKNGYYTVSLYKDRVQDIFRVNRLVLLAFIGDSKLQACHKNGNPSDNRLENLYWGTNSQNTLDQVRHGTHKESQKENCPRKHSLVEPNLDRYELNKRNKRMCRACKNAKIHVSRHGGDIQVESDKRYRKIMGYD